jgi:hypothetical protein
VRYYTCLVAVLAVCAGIVAACNQTPPAACVGVQVPAGASIQAASDANPAGSTLCLAAGTYTATAPIVPRDGDTVEGAGVPGTYVVGQGAPQVFNLWNSHGVTISYLDVSGGTGTWGCRPSCGQGIRLSPGNTASHVDVHDNPNTGIGGLGGTVEFAEVYHNGSIAFDGCCDGGIKFGNGGGTVIDSYVHDNHGAGIWCDVGCGGPGASFVVRNDIISGNTGSGVRYEISDAQATIADDSFWGNGRAGVSVVSSQNATITDDSFDADAGIAVDFVAGTRPPGLGNDSASANSLQGGDVYVGCTLAGVSCLA